MEAERSLQRKAHSGGKCVAAPATDVEWPLLVIVVIELTEDEPAPR